MPNNTVYNNKASSNIVYLYGSGLVSNEDCDCCCPFGVVPTREDLGFIENPQDLDVIFIQNGVNNGVDIAIFLDGQWIIKPLKGAKGDKGDKGDKGEQGQRGTNGRDGLTGATGLTGAKPNHRWSGTALQIELPDGSWGTLVELRGQDGANGTNGLNGARGEKPNHDWQNTSLRFELPNGTWGVYVNLKGDTGEKGDFPTHEFSSTGEIRFQNPDGSWGQWQNIKGEQGIQGQQGEPGEVPYIGTNGNWWVVNTDTGVPATADFLKIPVPEVFSVRKQIGYTDLKNNPILWNGLLINNPITGLDNISYLRLEEAFEEVRAYYAGSGVFPKLGQDIITLYDRLFDFSIGVTYFTSSPNSSNFTKGWTDTKLKPELWMFRFKNKPLYNRIDKTSGKNKDVGRNKKGWVHPTDKRNLEYYKSVGSAFYGGLQNDYQGKSIDRDTEFIVPQNIRPYQKFTIKPNLDFWFGGKDVTGLLDAETDLFTFDAYPKIGNQKFPIRFRHWEKSLKVCGRKGGRTKSFVFRFAFSVINTLFDPKYVRKNGEQFNIKMYPRIIGGMSEVLVCCPNIVGGIIDHEYIDLKGVRDVFVDAKTRNPEIRDNKSILGYQIKFADGNTSKQR